MKTVILTSNKEADLQLLLELASKLGIKTRLLTEEETEDLGLIYVYTLTCCNQCNPSIST